MSDNANVNAGKDVKDLSGRLQISKFSTYCSVPGKCPWVLYHNSKIFITLGAYPVYWALVMWQIMHEISGWSQHTTAIATRSQSLLTSAPVLRFSHDGRSFIEHRRFLH